MSNCKNQSITNTIDESENKVFFQMPQSQYKECIKYSSMHLRAVDNQIQALKCCLKYEPGEALKSWSFEEFSKIPDIWVELEALNNVTPSTHDDSIPAICPFKDVKKCKWDWKTWPLTRLEIGFEPHCNAHCRFCHIHPAIDNFYTKEEKQLLKDIYFKTLKSIKGKHLERVQLSEQGEPFFFKDETLEYLLSLTPEDTKEVSAFTNFTILTENDIRMLYENIRIKFIPIVSFHGWDPKSYSELTGMNEDYFYKVLNNCKTAVQCGAELESIFVIDDINNLEKVYNFIIENSDIFKDKWHIQNEILQPEISEKISAFLNEKAQQK